MVDEFQDTNRLQLDVLERLERDNLFVVGDEFQSIYGFRHADVEIFRRRATGRARRLTANFRSRPELLATLNAVFEPIFGEGFAPLVSGLPPADPDRLFDPDHIGASSAPAVELLLTDRGHDWDAETGLGLEIPGEHAWRRAEARRVALRLRAELDGGRRAGEIAVLVRAATSIRLIEQALEEAGVPTYVVGGRGYWSQEQVRDGLAYLSVLANPLDEASLYAVLASPFANWGSAELVALARSAQADGGSARGRRCARPAGHFAELLVTERERAQRVSAELLLERAIAATGYDVAVLARPGGERRLANLRKLMRLAREYERSEGRDLRAFVDHAVTQDLSGAREGEAAIESEGLEAVRLMTIHRAKGLEFGVVCVADLGRQGPGGGPPLLLDTTGRGRIGLRLRTLGSAVGTPALDHPALNEERLAREDAEERRLFYVAMTRAQERLILSGGIDLGRPPTPRPGGAPIAWIAPALDGVIEAEITDPTRLRGAPAQPTAQPAPAPRSRHPRPWP